MNDDFSTVQAGIVGAGLMGYWHARAIKRAGGQVAAVMDRDAHAAQQLANRFPGSQSFTDLSQMLDQALLHVLHICTPTPTHFVITETAIGEGLHVMVEKPLAPTGPETQHLFNLAAERGVQVCPVHQFVFQEGVIKAKHALPRIGRLVHLQCTVRSAGGEDQPAQVMDQIAADILPHSLSLIQVFLPADLATITWGMTRLQHGELRVLGEVDGVTIFIDISMNGRPTVNAFEVVGTNGTIHLDLFHSYAFIEPGTVSKVHKITRPFDLSSRRLAAATINLGRRALQREPAYPGLRRLIQSFYTAIQDGTTSPISPKASIDVAFARDDILLKDPQIGIG